MRDSAVAISGAAASGKTTVAAALSALLGWAKCSFGGYVRLVATERGIEHTRENLQALGESLLAADEVGFCRNVLAQARRSSGTPVIVEGVRHVTVVATLRELLKPLPVVFVYLRTDERQQAARLLERDGSATLNRAHSTEREVPLIEKLADLVVDASLQPEEAAARIRDYLEALPP